ncbi:MAG TPA: hypothetical protein VI874_02160 [Candidatus Norongarragalinales archaeon]|nr:hypothetical protein [Candidatus Norongarragalinales archaeon]
MNIPVKKETKDTLDLFKKILGTKTYDQTVQELSKANSLKLLTELEGIWKGAPNFKREKNDRNFG